MRALWLVLVGVLLFVLWNNLLSALGLGVLLLPVVIVGLTMMYWLQRLSLLWERWNTWLGALVFTAALLGFLAFFQPANMGMENPWVGARSSLSNATLGGSWGEAIIGGRNLADSWHTVLGILRILGLLIVGAALVAPHWVWDALSNWLAKAVPLFGRIGQKARDSAGGAVDHYSENPLHEKVLNWLKERETPKERKGKR